MTNLVSSMHVYHSLKRINSHFAELVAKSGRLEPEEDLKEVVNEACAQLDKEQENVEKSISDIVDVQVIYVFVYLQLLLICLKTLFFNNMRLYCMRSDERTSGKDCAF